MTFRITFNPCLETGVEHKIVSLYDTAAEMIAARDAAAGLLLYLHEHKLMEDSSNLFMMEELVAVKYGVWSEYLEDVEIV